MHLKVSRAQARCSLGGDTVDFRGRRGDVSFSAVPRRSPGKNVNPHRACQDNRKDARVTALVFVKIEKTALSLLAAFASSFLFCLISLYSLC